MEALAYGVVIVLGIILFLGSFSWTFLRLAEHLDRISTDGGTDEGR